VAVASKGGVRENRQNILRKKDLAESSRIYMLIEVYHLSLGGRGGGGGDS